MINGFKDLKVYQLAFRTALGIFNLTKKFPADEKFEMVSQIRRSSRSVCSNIAEGYRKKKYPKHFSSKMTDADSEASETCVWLDFARECEYITLEEYQKFTLHYEEVGRMLGHMAMHPEKFKPKEHSKVTSSK
jgi:four helix bundle protein